MSLDNAVIQKALQGSIIDILGIDTLPEEEKRKIVYELGDLALIHTSARIAESLAPSERETFSKNLSEDPESAILWLKERGIIFEELLAEEIGKIKGDLAERVKNIP